MMITREAIKKKGENKTTSPRQTRRKIPLGSGRKKQGTQFRVSN
jgi:hypothetical protein